MQLQLLRPTIRYQIFSVVVGVVNARSVRRCAEQDAITRFFDKFYALQTLLVMARLFDCELAPA